MKLNLSERFSLLNILPQEGNFVTLKIIRDLTSGLAPNDKEFKEFDIKQRPGANIQETETTWNLAGNVEKGIEIGEKSTDIIVAALTKLDETEKLEPRYLSLYEKFVLK